jgi:hypothetical protein
MVRRFVLKGKIKKKRNKKIHVQVSDVRDVKVKRCERGTVKRR